MAVGNFI